MVGMPSFPVGKNHHSRPLLAKHTNHLQPVFPGVLDPAVGNVESFPPRDAENLSRVGRFLGTIFGGAARSHLALRQIEDAGAIAALRHLEQSAAAGLFNIVAVRGDG